MSGKPIPEEAVAQVCDRMLTAAIGKDWRKRAPEAVTAFWMGEVREALQEVVPALTAAQRGQAFDVERARTLIDYVIGYARAAELKSLSSDACVALRDLHAMLHTAPPLSVPEAVRRLVGKLDQWRHCMSHNESYFGEPAGLVKSVSEELARVVAPIYPDPVPEPDPLAGVTIRTATVPFASYLADGRVVDNGPPNPPTPPAPPAAAAVPDGFVLVPVEPTDAMTEAAARVVLDVSGESPDSVGLFAMDVICATQRNAYAAMLAAAQKDGA